MKPIGEQKKSGLYPSDPLCLARGHASSYARAGAAVVALTAMVPLPAWAQSSGAEISSNALIAAQNPMFFGVIGAACVAVASIAWALRISAASRNHSATWSEKLAEMEARLEKSDAVLSAHPGLVLVWDDDYDAVESGWGDPKVLGGPAALASLMSFAKDEDSKSETPVGRLLNSLGELPLEDDGPSDDIKKLSEKVRELRAHGIAFSGSVITSEGRSIEADGRVAGGQVALWLTDPAVRWAEDGGIMGKIHEKTADLHGALSQLERSPFPAWRRSADLKIVWVNKAYVEAVEAANAAAVLKDQVELDAGVRKVAEQVSKERRPLDGRITVNVKGSRLVYRITEMPMHAAGDAALAGFAADITDLEKSRTDLRHYIESNRRTLDQVPAAVALFGANQDLTYYNNAFAKLWGLDDADLAARPSHGELLDRLRHDGKLPEPENFNSWKKQQLALYTEDISAPGGERDGAAPDEVWNLPDGRTLRVARARHPLGGVLIIFDDITEKMTLEARYNTQINVQRATLNNLAEGVAVFAADGHLRLFNEAFQKLWRLEESLLKSNPHIDKIMNEMRGRVSRGAEILADIKRRSTSMSPDDRVAIKDGVLSLADGRTLNFGTEPLPDGATLVHFLDVTDSREREKELKDRNALLEEIDRQKSKFVDHVSYTLRTPLNTILGFSEMLEGQMFGVLNDRQKDYVASILSASHHLRDLITDIIDLAAIDAGKLSIEKNEVDLRKLLENAATYAALKAEDTQVKLRVDCVKDIGTIHADDQRLKQVLFNLMSNAFAYTGSGGEVVIGADRTPGLVRIWVQDSGRGVSPDDQAKAFDAFESSGPSAGAGLGLSLVKRFVGLHGGWVRMESAPGEGTKVTCFLPAGVQEIITSQPVQSGDVKPAKKPSVKSAGTDHGGGERAKKPAQKADAAEPARRRKARAEAAE